MKGIKIELLGIATILLGIKNGSETNDDHCTDHGKDDRLFRREYP